MTNNLLKQRYYINYFNSQSKKLLTFHKVDTCLVYTNYAKDFSVFRGLHLPPHSYDVGNVSLQSLMSLELYKHLT